MITIGKHVVAGYSPAGQSLVGQSLAGVMAILLLVLAPVGDAMAGDDELMLEFAKTGNVAGIRTLLAAGADVDAADASGFTPLHLAAVEGHADVATALLAAGAYIEAETEHGFTPLHYAAFRGQVDVVTALLAAGAYPEAEAEGGVTPLHLARTNKHYKIANILKQAETERP